MPRPEVPRHIIITNAAAKAFDKKHGKGVQGFNDWLKRVPTKQAPVPLMHGNMHHPEAEERERMMEAFGKRHNDILNRISSSGHKKRRLSDTWSGSLHRAGY